MESGRAQSGGRAKGRADVRRARKLFDRGGGPSQAEGIDTC